MNHASQNPFDRGSCVHARRTVGESRRAERLDGRDLEHEGRPGQEAPQEARRKEAREEVEEEQERQEGQEGQEGEEGREEEPQGWPWPQPAPSLRLTLIAAAPTLVGAASVAQGSYDPPPTES